MVRYLGGNVDLPTWVPYVGMLVFGVVAVGIGYVLYHVVRAFMRVVQGFWDAL